MGNATAAWPYALSVLIFGLLVIGIMALLLRGRTVGEVLRLVSLPLIIVAAIYLFVIRHVAEGDEVNSFLTLLSTIAGYLLKNIGDSMRDKTKGEPPPARPIKKRRARQVAASRP